MRLPRKLFYAGLLCATTGAFAGLNPAQAAVVIGTTGETNANFSSFGSIPGAATTIGELFTVPAASHLDSFSLWLRNVRNGSGTLDLRGYVATWDGAKIGTVLYASDIQTMNAAGTLQQFTFAPDLSLTTGQQYVAFLSVLGLSQANQVTFQWPLAFEDYAGGAEVHTTSVSFDGLSIYDWPSPNANGFDTWFQASFTDAPSTTPLPAALPLFATGLGALGLLAHRKRRERAIRHSA